MDTETLINSLTSSLESTSNRLDHRDREAHNSVLGLITTSAMGNSCLTAGIHPDMPDVFIKVVTLDDPVLLYLEAIQDGVLTGSLFPKVHSITRVIDCYIILMEKLEVETELVTDDSEEHAIFENEFTWAMADPPTFDKIEKYRDQFYVNIGELKNFLDWIENERLSLDLHRYNFGLRPNTKEVVIFDPLWCSDHFKGMTSRPKFLTDNLDSDVAHRLFECSEPDHYDIQEAFEELEIKLAELMETDYEHYVRRMKHFEAMKDVLPSTQKFLKHYIAYWRQE